MAEKLPIILGLTALGVGGTVLIFFLFRTCIRKAALNKRRFVSILHLILLAVPVVLFFLQDLKVLHIAWPSYIFWITGIVCALLPLFRNIKLWGVGYGLIFTLCEIFSSISLSMLTLSIAYGAVVIIVVLLAVVISFISSSHIYSQMIRVGKTPFDTDYFYVTPVSYGGFVDGEGVHYTSMSKDTLLSSDGDIYYILG